MAPRCCYIFQPHVSARSGKCSKAHWSLWKQGKWWESLTFQRKSLPFNPALSKVLNQTRTWQTELIDSDENSEFTRLGRLPASREAGWRSYWDCRRLVEVGSWNDWLGKTVQPGDATLGRFVCSQEAARIPSTPHAAENKLNTHAATGNHHPCMSKRFHARKSQCSNIGVSAGE